MLENKYIRILLAVVLVISGSYLPVRALSSTKDITVEVPVIMYHKVSADEAQWGDYTIAPMEFENDLKYLQDNGYTTIFISDLINYVYLGEKLPKKPVVLTFDDGYFSDYNYVYPLLQAYEMKAVFSIIGTITDEYSEEGREDINYPHVTWDQINEMIASGVAEIQNHGYDLHNQDDGRIGAGQANWESDEEYREFLTGDIFRMQERIEEMTDVRADVFTYPFGKYTEISEEIIIELGMRASLVCEERVNQISPDNPDGLYKMGRNIRPHGTGIAAVLAESS